MARRKTDASVIVRTEAVPLRSIEFGETSLIVTLYTREMGKLTVIAKGARSNRSRFGSCLQPMSYIQAVFYYKASREIQTLKESGHIVPFNRMLTDMNRISSGLRIVELVNALMHDADRNTPAFSLLVQVLRHLDEDPHVSFQLFHYFQLRMAAILGFAPQVERAEVERIESEGGVLRLDTGAVLPLDHSGGYHRQASRSALRTFAILARCDLETILRFRPDPRTAAEAGTLVDAYLQFHFPEQYPSRAGRVISQMGSVR